MDIKETALRAAKEAGGFLRENLGRVRRIEYKGEVDLVTEMDLEAERRIVSIIRERFPDHGILTEESSAVDSAAPFRWIIDPLDGTTNYAHGYPVFSVSIAFEKEGRVLFGVVYDPMLEETFTAELGRGALLNGRTIRVSAVDSLSKALIATGFPYDVRTSRENNLDNFARFALRAQAVRRAGSAALDLSYVGCGRFDGFWEMKLKPWDLAAAALVVTEAGGRLTDFTGGEFSIYRGECLATNGLIHQEMLDVLKGV